MESLFWKFSGGEVKDNSSLVSVVSSSLSTEEDRYDTFLILGNLPNSEFWVTKQSICCAGLK